MANNKKELSIITHNMSEHDRSEYLKTRYLDATYIKIDKSSLSIIKARKTQPLNIIRKKLRELAKSIGVYKEYKNIGDTIINAFFSRNKLDESIQNSVNKTMMYFVIANIDSIIEKSIKIEEHTDNKNDINIKCVHEMLSIIQIHGNKNIDVIVIKITIKESNNTSNKNTLYSIANLETIKKAIYNPPSTSEDNKSGAQVGSRLPSKISLPHLIKCVNNSDILRYIPSEMLSNEQICIKEEGIKRYNKKKEYQKK